MSLERQADRYAGHNRFERGLHFVWGGEERADVFRRLVGGPSKRVLDLGCRYGALTRWYAAGNEVVGVDVDREALTEAGRRLGIETRWADVEEGLDFPAASFDVVVIGELLEHLRDPTRLIDDARRVLKPGGRLVASVPNSYRLKNRVRFAAGRKPENDPTHLHMFTPDDVRAWLTRFDSPEVYFVAGRFVRVHPRLFANMIVFSGQKPPS